VVNQRLTIASRRRSPVTIDLQEELRKVHLSTSTTLVEQKGQAVRLLRRSRTVIYLEERFQKPALELMLEQD